MSNPALDWAIGQDIGDPVAKFVLVVLANRLNGQTGRLDPSIDQLCRDTGGSRATVIRKLQWLADKGFVTSQRHRRGANSYVLKWQQDGSKPPVKKSQPATSKTTENANQEVSKSQLRSLNLRPKKSQPATLSLKPESKPEGNGRKSASHRAEARASDTADPPAKRTPKEALEEVLSPATAEAVIEHRQALRSKLTLRAAELLAKEYAIAPLECGLTPDQAADWHIAAGWRGFKAQYVVNARDRDRQAQRKDQPQTLAEYAREKLRRMQ